MNKNKLFSIKNIYVKYNKKYILENFSLDIFEKEFFVILGPNGCGKSTLIKSLVRVNKLTSGNILYKNKFIELPFKSTLKLKLLKNKFNISWNNFLTKMLKKKKEEYHKRNQIINKIIENDKFLINHWKEHQHIHAKQFGLNVSYVPQLQNFPEDTSVYEFVKLGRFPHSNKLGINFDFLKENEIILDSLKYVGIEELKDKFLNELSGGQRQKALIALALAQQTETIILDEPTNHLDIKSQIEILNLLNDLHKKQNKNIIMIIHDINSGIKFADKICLMNSGKIVDLGTVDQIINQENLNKTFGINVQIIDVNDKKQITNIEI